MWARAAGDDRLMPMLQEGLAALTEDDVELRARLLARLAGVLRDERPRARRDALSREAVELARQSGNPAALAFALDGRLAAMDAPDTLAEGITLARELRGVAEQIGDREREVNALDHERTRLVMAGDLREAETALEEEGHLYDDLRQPAQLWQHYSALAMFALAAGRLTEAEKLVPHAFAFGERSLPDVAIPVYRLQRYALCELRGRLDEAAPRSATSSPSIRHGPPSAARWPMSRRGSGTSRRRSERSTTSRKTASRGCPSIRSGSTG